VPSAKSRQAPKPNDESDECSDAQRDAGADPQDLVVESGSNCGGSSRAAVTTREALRVVCFDQAWTGCSCSSAGRVVSIRVGDKSVDQRPFGPLGLAFAFLNETFSLRRRMAGTSTFGTGLATERQVGRDVVLALTDRALCQLALTCCAHYALTQSGDVNQHTPNVRV
jgi:hypothetical protein